MHETTSDLPLPEPLRAPAKATRPVPPVVPTPHETPRPAAVSPELTVGAFYAEHRALVDARRAPLARLGMLPQHVNALRMPDLAETPLIAPLRPEDQPETPPAKLELRALPKLPGVNATPDEE